MLATIRAGLLQAGTKNPGDHVVILRSAWNVRILVRRTAWDPAAIASAKKFADDRSFDVSFYPGIDVASARASIYNDLPPVSFERGELTSSASAQDAVADEAGLVLAGQPTPSKISFNLAPITENRPFFYDVLRLNHLPLLLRRIEILPQAEIAPLVNLAVLAQAILLACAVLAVPLFFRRRRDTPAPPMRKTLFRTAIYFAALGLGFLFIEIAAIEKAAFFLNDRASAFALVLTAMLIFSGIGSLLSTRVRSLAAPVAVIAVWCVAAALLSDQATAACADLPYWARAALVPAILAPVSLALGVPFPLGLRGVAQDGPVLPWAWALNGAFSVVATPLANLGAITLGLDKLLFAALALYGLCYAVYPAARPKTRPTDNENAACPDHSLQAIS